MIIDSNIIIYAAEPPYASLRRYLNAHQTELIFSEISVVEVLGYHQLTAAKKASLDFIFSLMRAEPVSTRIIQEATLLRQHRKMSLGDALIAATCLLHGEPLLTNNEADFQHLPNLTVIPMRTVN